MKRAVRILLFACITVLPCTVHADAIEMGIVTGSEKGTYYQFGQDMRELVVQHGIDLTVYSSRGSFENILTIYDRRSVQLGLAQSDVVIFMQLFGEPKVKALAEEVKVVFPLYTEEIHLLARAEINDFTDLNDKKVAIDQAGSGTAMTANVLFEISGIKPAELVEIGGQEAIDALRSGAIDAMLYVAGSPVILFQEHVSKSDNLHLAPITDENIIDFYGTETTIPANTYAWQDQEVKTLDIMAGLMTLDYSPDNVNCLNVKRFASIIRENLVWLREHGHKKWQTADLDAPVAASLQSPCAAQ